MQKILNVHNVQLNVHNENIESYTPMLPSTL